MLDGIREGRKRGAAGRHLCRGACTRRGLPVALVAVKPGADEDHQEKCLSQLYDHMPEGLTPLATLKSGHQRRQLGTWRLSRLLPRQPPTPTPV